VTKNKVESALSHASRILPHREPIVGWALWHPDYLTPWMNWIARSRSQYPVS